MRSVRCRRVKNGTSKYLAGPYDDSLIQIQLDKNEKCIQEVSRDNFTRAAEFLRQIKADGQMISPSNPDKTVIQCLSLNTEAYLHEKEKKFELSLRCLEEAQRIEAAQKLSAVERARTKLNKSVILIHLGRHEESVRQVESALELLKHKRGTEDCELQKNQYKLYEIMVLSFHNIASQLVHLSEADGAHKVYKEGYYFAQKMLGPQHKLTHLLKSIIRSHNQRLSKSKQRIQISDIASNRSQEKAKQAFKEQTFPVKDRQKQLKRIYAPKRSSYSQAQQEKYLKNDTGYYLRSLERMSESKRRKHAQTFQFELPFKERSTGKIRKLHTQSSNPNRYEEKIQHQKIQDIILNSKAINKSHVYCTLNRSHSIQKEKSLPKIKVEPQKPPAPVIELPKIAPEKPKPIEPKEESSCQLI